MPRSQLRPNPHPAPGYARRAALRARPTMLSMGAGYSDLVLSTDPIAYWPLWETGGSVAQCLVNPAQNGTAVGVTWANDLTPMGTPAPFFDGANDYVDIFSVALRASFGYAAGTMMGWAKVSGAGVWTDGVPRNCFRFVVDANNYMYVRKDSVNNQVAYARKAGGVMVQINGANTSTIWWHWAITWDDTANQMNAFLNGAPLGPAAHVGNWAGDLINTNTLIGASNKVPAEVFSGWQAAVAAWDRVLPPATINALATV